MDRITFRSITPVFRFRFDQDDAEFLQGGKFRDTTYGIVVKKYISDTADFDELIDWSPHYSVLASVFRSTPPTYGVVVDVSQGLTTRLELGSDSGESRRVTRAILDALRLHASKGLPHDRTYLLRHPPHPMSGLASAHCPVNQYRLSHLGISSPSVLLTSEFDACRSTFHTLISRHWANATFARLVGLALEYHRVAFQLEVVEHSFLLLMIVFEALFKKKGRRGQSKASDLISKLLSVKKSDRAPINTAFCGREADTFYRLRNSIAHGDPRYPRDTVKFKYRELYRYVTRALIELISIPDAELARDSNYYDELSRVLNDRFKGLPD